MAEQTSRLAVIIDSSGAQKSAETLASALDNLSQEGKKAETATDNLSSATKDLNSWLKQGPKAASDASKAIEDEAKSLNSLLEKIRPTNKALSQLDSMSKQLSQSFSKGLINESQFNTYDKILGNLVNKYEKVDDELTGIAQAEREAAAAAKATQQAHEAEALALQKMLDKLDPVSASVRRLEQDQQSLQSAFSSGKISGDEYDKYSESIARARKEVTGEAQAERDAAKAREQQEQSFQRMLDKIDPVSSALRNLEKQQNDLSAALSSGKISADQYGIYAQKVGEARREVNGEAQAERDAAEAHDAQVASLQRLIAQLDPLGESFRKLSQQQQQLDDAKSSGMLSTDRYTELSAALTKTRDELQKTAEVSHTTAHAMQMLPMQMSYILSGLASGQSPFMVLIQQGGWLTGMFGGLGATIKGVGTYVAGLVNPFTVAAAAVGVLGLAYYEGVAEQEEFRKSLILTGNQVGKTADQLSDMATTISNVTGSTHGQAASVINQVVSAGNIAGDSLQKVSSAIVSISDATGQATDKLVSDFSNIANDPVAAITKLNDQYHFLTLATYNQIKALQDEGDQQDAARVASDAYATELSSRAVDINKNLGTIEAGWRAITIETKGAIDAMLSVGRVQTLQQKLDIEKNGLGVGQWSIYNAGNAHAGGTSSDISILQSAVNLQNDLSGAISSANAATQRQIALQQQSDKDGEQFATAAEKRAKAIKLEKTYLDAGVISLKEYGNRVSRISEMYKDPAAPKQHQGKAYKEDAGSRLVDQLNQQHAALVAQLDTTQKLGAAQQELVKWQTKLDGLSKKQNLTNDEKSLLAHQKQITAAYQRNANDELDQRAKVEARKVADYQNQLSQQLQTAINANAASQQGLGMGSLQAGRYKYLQQLQAQQDTDSNALLNKRDRGDITDSTYQAELTSLRSYYQQRAQIAKEGYAQEDAARQDWQKGLTNGLHNSIDAANDMYSQMSTLAQTAFTGMADSLANFVVTGKANFKDFTTTILTDLAKIEMERALAGIATSIFSFSGTSANAGTAISSTASSTGALGLPTSYTGYDSGGFTGVGGKYDPAGIVHKGEFVFTQEATNRIGKDNLARLMKGYSSGGYVGSPALSSVDGTSKSSGNSISLGGIVVNVNSQGQASSDSSTGGQSIARQIQAAVVNTINEQANKQGTPLWRAIKGR